LLSIYRMRQRRKRFIVQQMDTSALFCLHPGQRHRQ
jgi:hypothetical protein